MRQIGSPLALAALLVLGCAGALRAAPVEFVAYAVEAERALPQVCLTFTNPLPRAGSVELRPFVAVAPPSDTALATRGSDLCVAGLRHGGRYEVSVRAGLPDAEGNELAQPVRIAVTVPDRAPRVGFRGDGYVLPLDGGAGLPLTSVNVDRAHVRILRVPERNVVPELAQGLFGMRLNEWSTGQLLDLRGEELFAGDLQIDGRPNEEVTTAIPVRELVQGAAPGVYVATAEPAGLGLESWQDRATQWFTISDLGLLAYEGGDGLTVLARSLATAAPKPGVELRLMARNNEELARVLTDGEGRAAIDGGLLHGRGGLAPEALLAFGGDGDLTFLHLARPGLDLGELDVEGRTPPGAVDAFLTTERGAYRPGETVHLTLLLRDAAARPLGDLPVTVKLVRPDAIELERHVVTPEALGGAVLHLPLAPGAFTGEWQLTAHIDPEGPPVGRTSFLVESFVPPRLEVAVTTREPYLDPARPLDVEVRAAYLYGAPGAELPGEVELTIHAADAPFPGFEGYGFGLVEEPFLPVRLPPATFRADGRGEATLRLMPESSLDTPNPLAATLRARVFDIDGRPVTATLQLPVRHADGYIGIRPSFTGSLGEGVEARFDLVLVDAEGRPLPERELAFDLVREIVDYVWFQRAGQWDFEPVVTDEPVTGGQARTDAAGRASLALPPVEGGRYRLEVRVPESGILSSHRFTAGWWAAGEAGDRPDAVEVTLERGATPGVRAFIKPPYAGTAVLALADTRVRHLEVVEIGAEGRTVELPGPGFGPGGGHLLVTVIAPSGAVAPRLPVRAVGAAWVEAGEPARALAVEIAAPESARPRTSLPVGVRLAGLPPGEEAYVTLAAVDEGILQLTGFATPDPYAHFFGRRALGVTLRDLYGRLLDPGERRGRIVTGGDAQVALQAGEAQPGIESVALVAGPLRADGNGGVEVALDLPDFTGRLRLMAVAWAADGAGAAEAQVVVREALVAELTRPRFLAPGDRAELLLRLTNIEGPPGEFRPRVTLDGPGALSPAELSPVTLAAGESATVPLALQAGDVPGLLRLGVAVEGPGGLAVGHDHELAVRMPQPYVTDRRTVALAPGESLRIDAALAAGLLPGTATARVEVAGVPALDTRGLIDELAGYPYGCVEQLTSRAFGLLAGLRLGGPGDERAAAEAGLQQALRRLWNLQAATGGYGGWSPLHPSELWLSAYVADFLLAVREAGVPVAGSALERGLDWLAGELSRVGDEPAALTAAAYAAHVLVQAGRLDPALLRYVAGRSRGRLVTDLARVQIAAALARSGEQDLARAFLADLNGPRPVAEPEPLYDYGSQLRDQAGVLAIAAEADLLTEPQLIGRAEALADAMAAAEYTSTQEQAWALRAATAFAPEAGAGLALAVDGRPFGGVGARFVGSRPLDGDAPPLEIQNVGQRTAYATLSVTGIPAAPPAAAARGFRIERRYLTPGGEPLAGDRLRQNDQVVVLIEGEAPAEGHHETLVVDLLPAGLELESVRLAGSPSLEELAWLGDLSVPEQIELRDDRYVAALDLGPWQRSFRVAYLARAVTPGRFVRPGAYVEDMYRPHLFARSAQGGLTVERR